MPMWMQIIFVFHFCLLNRLCFRVTICSKYVIAGFFPNMQIKYSVQILTDIYSTENGKPIKTPLSNIFIFSVPIRKTTERNKIIRSKKPPKRKPTRKFDILSVLLLYHHHDRHDHHVYSGDGHMRHIKPQ